ncbi:unnamed protein product [Pylaiella littoralis]
MAAAVASSSDQPLRVKQRAIIVGGGPAGALMALYLSQEGRGFEVDLFEREKEDRISGPTVRSWNIAVFERGTDALEAGGFDMQKEVGVIYLCITASMTYVFFRRHDERRKKTEFRHQEDDGHMFGSPSGYHNHVHSAGDPVH